MHSVLERMDLLRFIEERFGFKPHPKQAEVLWSGASRLLLCCSRQWGKSTTASALAAHRALTVEGALVLCVSPTLRQSAEFVSKVRGFLMHSGEKLEGGRLGVRLKNGSRVVALPGQEANVRGFSAPSLIVIDEAARVSDVLYQALRPMLVVGRGDLALLSTPFGERGFFWKEWAAGGERWTRIEVKATDCPRMLPDALEVSGSARARENQAFQNAWRRIKLEAGGDGGTMAIVESVYEYRGYSPVGKVQKVSLPNAPGGTTGAVSRQTLTTLLFLSVQAELRRTTFILFCMH